MLEIRDLRASAGDKEILKGITLTVNPGEVHAVMGPNGSVGEVGHHTIDPNGPLCGCGNHGCWERFCGRDAIIDRTVRLLQTGRASRLLEQIERPHEVTPAMVAEAAADGDALALQVMEETGYRIGEGLTSAAGRGAQRGGARWRPRSVPR